MTKQLINGSCSILTSMFLFCSSFAQVSEFALQRPIPESHTIKVYENIHTEFSRQFGHPSSIAWTKVKKNYLAAFTENGQKHVALFTPRADLVYRISYGTVNNLPAGIRKQIKRMYVEFEITSAILVEEAGRSIWVVKVEDETNFALVRVENDEFEEVKKYTKAIPGPALTSTIVKH